MNNEELFSPFPLSPKLANELAVESFKGLKYPDSRIVRRTIHVAETIYGCPATKFSQMFTTPKEQQGAYRLIENEDLEVSSLIDSIVKGSQSRIERDSLKTIIAIQDTSTASFSPRKHIKGLGILSSQNTAGFLFHGTLGVAMEGTPFGLLGMKTWIRPKEAERSRNKRTKRPFEEKESFVWVESMRKVREAVPKDTHIIFVSDRESDIHEVFEEAETLKSSIVVRGNYDRRTVGGSSIFKELESSAPLGILEVDIPIKNHKGTRKAQLTIRKVLVTLDPPTNLPINRNRKQISLWVMQAKEESTPSEGDPIEWYIYTNIPINTMFDAKEVMRIYTIRWRIEEFHMVLKTGMKVEESELESVENIQRFLLLCIPMAIKLLEIIYMSRSQPETRIAQIFSKFEKKALEIFMIMQEKKPTNNISEMPLGEAIKIIAMQGGWKNRKRDGPPGVRTLWAGMKLLLFLARGLENQNRLKKRRRINPKCRN